MSYDIAVIGNDEAAFEMLCLAAGSGRRIVAVLPESRHSAWLVGQALRRLISGLLVDQTAERKRLFVRKGTPKLLQSLILRAIVNEVNAHVQSLERLGVDVILGEGRYMEGLVAVNFPFS